MAGALIKIDEEIVTSAVASVTLGGANWDSSYDVYMVQYLNVVPVTDNQEVRMRFTESGTPNTSANYDYAYKIIETGTFENFPATNQTYFRGVRYGNNTGEAGNATLYLFNMNSTTEYAFYTIEENAYINDASTIAGCTGGGVLTVTGNARDGIEFSFPSGNIASGIFSLFGLAK